MKGTNSKAKNIHLKYISNQLKGEINNNNNSTSSTDPKSKIQQEKNKSEKEIFVFNRNATQNTKVKFYQSIKATSIGEENETEHGENSLSNRALIGTL